MIKLLVKLVIVGLIVGFATPITLQVNIQNYSKGKFHQQQLSQPRKVRTTEIRYNLNKNLLKFTFETGNASHSGEVWVEVLSELDSMQLFLQVDPYDNNDQNGNLRMKYTVDGCRIEEDKSGNWFASIAVDEIRKSINMDFFKCPLPVGKYLVHSPMLLESSKTISVPAFLPAVFKLSYVETLKARVKGKLVELFIMSRVIETSK